MKPLKVMAVLLLLLPALMQAQKKPKKQIVPAVFAQARYAYVEAVDGNEFDPRVIPEDRDAIANIGNAIRAWGRYSLTMHREEADIVFVVRKGRQASTQGSIGVNREPEYRNGTERKRGIGPARRAISRPARRSGDRVGHERRGRPAGRPVSGLPAQSRRKPERSTVDAFARRWTERTSADAVHAIQGCRG